jgi:hypothetical protein
MEMEVFMLENLDMISLTGLEIYNMLIKIVILESLLMEKNMERENITFLKGHYLTVYGKMIIK